MRDDTSGQYLPSYYDACLVRPLALRPGHGAAEEALELNKKMQVVNWGTLLEKAGATTVGDFSELQIIGEIVQELNILAADEEGVYFADLLRLRYWCRTPFESYARLNNQCRSSFEINQRFHFFGDEAGITLDEAYRFLLHRWHEKKLQGLQRAAREIDATKGKKAGKD